MLIYSPRLFHFNISDDWLSVQVYTCTGLFFFLSKTEAGTSQLCVLQVGGLKDGL